MPVKPRTLYEILGITPYVPDDEIERVLAEKMKERKIENMSHKLPMQEDFVAAYNALVDPASRQQYQTFHNAAVRKTPLSIGIDDHDEYADFCTKTFLKMWDCPDGALGENNAPADLTKMYVMITFDGEPPPWYTPEPLIVNRKNFRIALITAAFLIAVGFGWWSYRYVYEAPERLADAIRSQDAALADTLDAITADESAFSNELTLAIGTQPSDGTMSDSLARICSSEAVAAQAWDRIRTRETDAKSLAKFEQSKNTIENRIKIGTFLEDDRKTLDADVTLLKKKKSSFLELRRELDLLRVLTEAEKQSSPTSAQSKGNT